MGDGQREESRLCVNGMYLSGDQGVAVKINSLEAFDVRFPTSRQLDGSDAMNSHPDYSAAYVVLRSDSADNAAGYGFVFTIGFGNDVQTAAIEALSPLVVGRNVDDICGDLGAFARSLTGHSHLRWLGPEKGVMHMAIGSVINAAWDLAARRAGKPLWRLLADMSPEQLVAQIDFRYITDALTPAEALSLLKESEKGKAERIADLLESGYPAYTTSPGWLGYPDEKVIRLAREAVASGFRTIKIKIGANQEDDIRRCQLLRGALGNNVAIAVDANQCWDVGPGSRSCARSGWPGLKSQRARMTFLDTPPYAAPYHRCRFRRVNIPKIASSSSSSSRRRPLI